MTKPQPNAVDWKLPRNPDRTFEEHQKSTHFRHVPLLPVLVPALDVARDFMKEGARSAPPSTKPAAAVEG